MRASAARARASASRCARFAAASSDASCAAFAPSASAALFARLWSRRTAPRQTWAHRSPNRSVRVVSGADDAHGETWRSSSVFAQVPLAPRASESSSVSFELR